MKVAITDPIATMPKEYVDKIKALGAEVYDDIPPDNAALIARLKDVEIATANYVDITKEIIDACPKLRYVIVPAVGYDWVDAGYAAKKGVKVVNCPTFVTLSVAEHAVALMFNIAKRISEADDDLRAGNWDAIKFKGLQLSYKKLGLIGYGNIGKMIHKLVVPLNMDVTYVNSKSTPDQVDKLVANSDVVCICAPLNESTRSLVDDRRLRLLKKSALLVNVGRGAIIDQRALIKHLKVGSFAAGLDVFDGEPDAKGVLPEEIHDLVNLPNVVATPHTAYNTPETLDRLGAEMLANIKSCIEGSPINVVN